MTAPEPGDRVRRVLEVTGCVVTSLGLALLAAAYGSDSGSGSAVLYTCSMYGLLFCLYALTGLLVRGRAGILPDQFAMPSPAVTAAGLIPLLAVTALLGASAGARAAVSFFSSGMAFLLIFHFFDCLVRFGTGETDISPRLLRTVIAAGTGVSICFSVLLAVLAGRGYWLAVTVLILAAAGLLVWLYLRVRRLRVSPGELSAEDEGAIWREEPPREAPSRLVRRGARAPEIPDSPGTPEDPPRDLSWEELESELFPDDTFDP